MGLFAKLSGVLSREEAGGRFHLESLEPRTLLSADLAGAVQQTIAPPQPSQTDLSATSLSALDTQPVASDQLVLGRFGNVPGGSRPEVSLRDADGTVTTFGLTGNGVGEVSSEGGKWSLRVAGTDGGSTVTIRTTGGNGRVVLDDLVVGSPLGAINAPTADVVGTIGFAGPVNAAMLGSVKGGTIWAQDLQLFTVVDDVENEAIRVEGSVGVFHAGGSVTKTSLQAGANGYGAIDLVWIQGALSNDSRIVADGLPTTASIAGKTVTVQGDPRFSIESTSPALSPVTSNPVGTEEQDGETTGTATAPVSTSPVQQSLTQSTTENITTGIYYASPNGTGNGLSKSSPFQISDFWAVAAPGKTLYLLDGTYRGPDSMIDPPDGLSGAAGKPITVKALNDGKVTIDGQDVRQPVRLYNNDYFILEGFNAHSSGPKYSVIEISGGSDRNVLRRIVGWDGGSAKAIFALSNANYNLLEDCAGFGVARKIVSSSYGGNNTTLRRFWGSWEASSSIGPKMTVTPTYNNTGMLIENSILTWKSPQSSIDQPYGMLSVDRMDVDRRTFAKIYGTIIYLADDAGTFAPGQQILVTKADEVVLKDVVSFFPKGKYTDKRTFVLGNSGTTSPNLRATNLTSIGGRGPQIASEWVTSNVKSGPDLASVYGSGESLFKNSGNDGATILYRYENGTLTNTPLWPWPMNQRIIDAMASAGRQPVDVTRTIQGLFGPIPGV
ncbi:LEPR-XLL domain-containing protein [Candidatus Nitrospira bockiana]